MITPVDIIDALRLRIAAAFPGEVLYENPQPVDFKVPCNALELDKATLIPDGQMAGTFIASVTVWITTFCAVDSYRHGDQRDLSRRAVLAAGPLLTPLVVQGRRLELPKCKLQQSDDRATWEATYTWRVSAAQMAEEAETLPRAADVNADIHISEAPALWPERNKNKYQ